MRKRIFLFSALTFLFLCTNCTFACQCWDNSIEDEIKTTDLIFVGKVTKINAINQKNIFGQDKVEVFFDVLKVYKGNVASGFYLDTVLEDRRRELEASCEGYNFEFNKVYLVFSKKAKDGTFGTDVCSRTKIIDHATEDLKTIEALTKSK